MRVLVSGSTGFVGVALCDFLRGRGHEVLRLVRGRGVAGQDCISWDPEAGHIDLDRLDTIDGVVHLSGENVAAGRWTEARKARIETSRLSSTALLCRVIAKQKYACGVFLCASGVGIYGNRGDEVLDEESAPGHDFLAELCRKWEAATAPAADAGIRVVSARFGMIVGREGGALKKMLIPFKLGLGGPTGSGRQYVSWVALADVLAAAAFLLESDALSGPVNVVSPTPVTNRAFAKALGRALNRPAAVPLPAFAARMLFGEMADALLLSSQRVMPRRLLSAGFMFQYTDAGVLLKRLFQAPA